jgi:hypothetical protein
LASRVRRQGAVVDFKVVVFVNGNVVACVFRTDFKHARALLDVQEKQQGTRPQHLSLIPISVCVCVGSHGGFCGMAATCSSRF